MIEKQIESRFAQQSQLDDMTFGIHKMLHQLEDKKQNKISPSVWIGLMSLLIIHGSFIAYKTGTVISQLNSLDNKVTTGTRDRWTSKDAKQASDIIAKELELFTLRDAILQEQISFLKTELQLLKTDIREHNEKPWHTLAGHMLEQLKRHVDYEANKKDVP